MERQNGSEVEIENGKRDVCVTQNDEQQMVVGAKGIMFLSINLTAVVMVNRQFVTFYMVAGTEATDTLCNLTPLFFIQFVVECFEKF